MEEARRTRFAKIKLKIRQIYNTSIIGFGLAWIPIARIEANLNWMQKTTLVWFENL
jgi:hypothetical protein